MIYNDYLTNKKFIIGLGIGLVISSMVLYYYSPNIPDSKIETKARKLGMMYPNEIKAYFNNDKK